jgi:hypothetical protein
MGQHFLDYYRCPEPYARFTTSGTLSNDPGYFRWGRETLCYGRTTVGFSPNYEDTVSDIDELPDLDASSCSFRFDPEEVTENLQRERYSAHFRQSGRATNAIIRKIYYLLRPFLSVPVRKRLQRVHLRGWDQISFPEWPVDRTVDRIHRKRLMLAMKAQNVDRVPFIWFWPDEYTSCAIITHDVEAPDGKEFCPQLMDLDESFGFRSSFQVVPEVRYPVSKAYLRSISDRGFEVNVHDLKHDGRLYAEHEEFQRRATRINKYAREFGAVGFRSGILYRNADWYEAFDFLYDMSIPNVGHLDPQRGGCCTVMPYFIGNLVELPLTCTQDYTLFHILKDYTIDLWKKQIELIRSHHGLVTILVHPDYVIQPREQTVYRELLRHLANLRDTDRMWTPLPRDVAQWWQQRSQMQLVCDEGRWRVEGAGKERARIAYAAIEDDHLTYTLEGEKSTVLP